MTQEQRFQLFLTILNRSFVDENDDEKVLNNIDALLACVDHIEEKYNEHYNNKSLNLSDLVD